MAKDSRNNEKLVVLVGILLIVMVAIVTFVRPSFKKESVANSTAQKTSTPETSNLPKISPADLEKKLNNNEKVAVVDINESDIYQQEHIVDSINMPLSTLNGDGNGLDQNNQIVLVGIGGTDTDVASAIKLLNMKNIAVLDGGIAAWKKAGGQTVSWGDPTSFVNQSKVNFINPEDLKSMLDSNQNFYLLDTRPQADYASGHILSAVNIPIDELEKRRREIPRGYKIIVYGDTELDGFRAGVRLYDLEIMTGQVMRGGFSSWKEKGFEIVQ